MSKLFARPLSLSAVTAALALAGCASAPYSNQEVANNRMEQVPLTRPHAMPATMGPLLHCVGNHIAQHMIYPVAIGNQVSDPTKKTGVEVGAVVNYALHQIAGRAGKLSIANFMMGSDASTPILQGGLIAAQADQARSSVVKTNDGPVSVYRPGYERLELTKVLTPDWVLVGGITSVANGVLSKQTSGEIAGSGLDGGASRSASVDVANIQLSLRDYATQREFPGAVIALSVHYQQTSISTEGGVLVELGFRGKKHAAGVRLSHSESKAQIAEDALRVGLEYATAFLLAERFGLDLATCPMPDDPEKQEFTSQGSAKATNPMTQELAQMKPAERDAWIAARLPALGFAFKREDRTAQAKALALFQLRHGLPPTGELDVTTFVRISQAKPVGPAGELGDPSRELRIATPWELLEKVPFGSHLRANAVVPRPGNLYCLFGEANAAFPVYPRTLAQTGFVTGRSQAALIPDPDHLELKVPGKNQLWCMLTDGSVLKRLPASLQPGALGQGFDSLEAASQAALQAAGSSLLASGEHSFVLADPPPPEDKQAAPSDKSSTSNKTGSKPTNNAASKQAPASSNAQAPRAAEPTVQPTSPRRLKG